MLRDPSLVPLSHQHHNSLALCVLTTRALLADASPENVAKQAARVVQRFEIELVNHFDLEERLLFPLLPHSAGELIADHREIERLAGQLRRAPSAETLAAYCELLRAHIRREENELFEQAQRQLPRAVLDELGAQLEAQAVRVCLQP